MIKSYIQVLNVYLNKEETIVPQTVLMEVSFRGIHVIDKRKKNVGGTLMQMIPEAFCTIQILQCLHSCCTVINTFDSVDY